MFAGAAHKEKNVTHLTHTHTHTQTTHTTHKMGREVQPQMHMLRQQDGDTFSNILVGVSAPQPGPTSRPEAGRNLVFTLF